MKLYQDAISTTSFFYYPINAVYWAILSGLMDLKHKKNRSVVLS